MARLLVLYSSSTGYTGKIADRIAGRLSARGHGVDVVDARAPPPRDDLDRIDGIVIGSWVRGGRHMPEVERFVERHRVLLDRVPSAFFSVSLLQISPRDKSRRRTERYIPDFVERTRWSPDLTAQLVGGMAYTRFGWLGRRIMRAVWRREGVSTDISRDHEYTRWQDVDAFADGFARLLPVQHRRFRLAL